MEPTAKNPDPHHIFIDEVQGHQRRWLKIIQFTSSSTKAAAIMLAAAIVALVIANSPFFEPFEEFWHTHVVVGVGGFIGEMSLAHIINDIFMAVFFLLVGLEIKYEMTVGELTNIRQAALPIIAACGGVWPLSSSHLTKPNPTAGACRRRPKVPGHHNLLGNPCTAAHPSRPWPRHHRHLFIAIFTAEPPHVAAIAAAPAVLEP
ncbi:MAG: Na+/H+ antiporter NhaA [Adlercreutzia equolifaciens]